MQPRQSGKTTKAIYEFLKKPNNTIYVVHNHHIKRHVHKLIGGDGKNITSASQFSTAIIGKRFKNVILDEYMFFQNRDEIYEYIMDIKPKKCFHFLHF